MLLPLAETVRAFALVEDVRRKFTTLDVAAAHVYWNYFFNDLSQKGESQTDTESTHPTPTGRESREGTHKPKKKHLLLRTHSPLKTNKK